ncbi:MAG: Gfo/Idh/MocA family oxidoreductase [Planctomycetota bacterium]|nr:Gfo/Idh/MocA family oxidoreductase [Planctomycetota bacterium]
MSSGKAGKPWKIVGINFDHMHMGDLLRQVSDHPRARIVGLCDEQPERMKNAIENFKIPASAVFIDHKQCLEKTKPDVAILCPATATHGQWTEAVAPFGVHILMEKPFAGSLAEADRMIAAVAKTGKQLAVNWPLRWYPSHVTAKRLVDEGRIGRVVEVHYYDGNRGPMFHSADKIANSPEEAARLKCTSWFYKKDLGGGSLQDYLGYGVTLGTWFHNNAAPIEVTCVVDQPKFLEVDEHSITIARYAQGLSKYETRWGTFTDPWTNQPQPKCGFVIKGDKGTIASYDYEKTIRVQTPEKPEGFDLPVDVAAAPMRGPIEYFLDCLERGVAVEGPLAPSVCRIGQQIIDSAALSAKEKRTVKLLA